MASKKISVFFIIAGLYDALLGLAFLVASPRLFDFFKTVPPNHYGYVQFPALILIIFGIMFFTIAKNPAKNIGLIPFGIMLKISYSGVVIGYWLTSGVANIFKPFAIIDLAFCLLFIACFNYLKSIERKKQLPNKFKLWYYRLISKLIKIFLWQKERAPSAKDKNHTLIKPRSGWKSSG